MKKLLTMTPEQDAWFRSRCDCATTLSDYKWQILLRQARSEIDALRELPVIETCGDCKHSERGMLGSPQDLCHHPARTVPEIVYDAPPANSCPLRDES